MMRDAMAHGVRTAAARFSIREGSALEAILGALAAGVGGSVARGAMNAVSPRLLPTLEGVGAAPVNAVRRMVAPTRTPADVLAKHLSKASLPPAPHGAPRIL
jgi:hypothetical protein